MNLLTSYAASLPSYQASTSCPAHTFYLYDLLRDVVDVLTLCRRPSSKHCWRTCGRLRTSRSATWPPGPATSCSVRIIPFFFFVLTITFHINLYSYSLQLFAFTTYYWTHRPNGFPAHNYPDFPSDLSTIFLGAVSSYISIYIILNYVKIFPIFTCQN